MKAPPCDAGGGARGAGAVWRVACGVWTSSCADLTFAYQMGQVHRVVHALQVVLQLELEGEWP